MRKTQVSSLTLEDFLLCPDLSDGAKVLFITLCSLETIKELSREQMAEMLFWSLTKTRYRIQELTDKELLFEDVRTKKGQGYILPEENKILALVKPRK